MALSNPKVERELLHLRDIAIRGYRRADGLYDIEGHLLDTKAREFRVASGLRAPGDAIHSMWLRVTIDKTLTIVDAEASTDAMPYVDYCDAVTPDYRKLVGLSLRPGFSNRVKELFGGVKGCTHITELIGSVATVAFQTLAGEGVQDPVRKPFQLDGCHALDTAGEAVRRFYPKWYRGAKPVANADSSENH